MPGAGAPVTANPQPKIHPCHPAANRQAWEQPLHFHASHASRCGVASVSRAPAHAALARRSPQPQPTAPGDASRAPHPPPHHTHPAAPRSAAHHACRRLSSCTIVAAGAISRHDRRYRSHLQAPYDKASSSSRLCDLRAAPSSCTSGNLLLPAAVQLISRNAIISKFG